jgi:hypothetical protein
VSDEPNLAELNARILDMEIKAARATIDLELAEAQRQTTEAQAEASYLRRRVTELEHALGRRVSMSQDRRRGVDRFMSNGVTLDQLTEATKQTPEAFRQLRDEKRKGREEAREEERRRVADEIERRQA